MKLYRQHPNTKQYGLHNKTRNLWISWTWRVLHWNIKCIKPKFQIRVRIYVLVKEELKSFAYFDTSTETSSHGMLESSYYCNYSFILTP